MIPVEDLLKEFKTRKELFRNNVLGLHGVQEYILEILHKARGKGIAKYSNKYNSSIKGLNLKIKEEFTDKLQLVIDPYTTLSSLDLSYKLILSPEIKNLLSNELIQDYDELIQLKQKIVEESHSVIINTVKNKKNFSSILDIDDLYQEAYIIADESVVMYDVTFSSDGTWKGYLSTRINQILNKKLTEAQPTLQVSRSRKDKITHYSLSDNIVNLLNNHTPNYFLAEIQSGLSPVELQFLELKYGLNNTVPHSNKEICNILKKSNVTLQSIEKNIFNKLRNYLK